MSRYTSFRRKTQNINKQKHTIMNIRFSGEIKISSAKKPKGYASEAAKAAFHDIREDEDMRVHAEICDGLEFLCSIILTEKILDEE